MPDLYIIAGPNGAGKTIASFTLLPQVLDIKEFVNADEIARGLSPFNPESVAFEAGRIMLQRIEQLVNAGASFAFETTLSTRSYAKLIRQCNEKSYKAHLLFLWLNSPELAIERVKSRAAKGGHNIPEETIRRRYKNGLQNFVCLFMPLCDEWIVADNSYERPETIAQGKLTETDTIAQPIKWKEILGYGKA